MVRAYGLKDFQNNKSKKQDNGNPDTSCESFLLKIIPDEGQIIQSVKHYRELPVKLRALSIGTDFAISKKETADYSAINVLGQGEDGNFYNLRSVAGRWDFNETLNKVNDTYTLYRKTYPNLPLTLGFEDVSYQKAAIQEFTRRHSIAPEAITRTTDKRARLETIQPYFASGQVFFREDGDDDLENEIINFGVEQHDDRADAFEMALSLMVNQVRPDFDLL